MTRRGLTVIRRCLPASTRFIVLPNMLGKGEKAPQKPWEAAEGLEWEVPSPAPFHTFENPPRLDPTATKVIG